MERMTARIKVRLDDFTLAYTSRWLLFPTVIKIILADTDKPNVSTKITFTNMNDEDRFLKNGPNSRKLELPG